MKIKTQNSSPEKAILLGAITNHSVIAAISDKWNGELFSTKWSNLICKWCVEYYRKYGGAPMHRIEEMFNDWSGRSEDKATIDLVDKFLTMLNGEYKALKKRVNVKYTIDKASHHFNLVRIKNHKDEIDNDIESGDVEKALERISNFSKVQIGQDADLDILFNENTIRQAFEEERESLITYDGALSDFYGNSLNRGNLIAFEGPEKSGKSWMLLDLAWRGMENDRKVAFFEVGDMSQNQVMRRFMVRACGVPMDKGEYQYPINLEPAGGDATTSVEHKTKYQDIGLDWERAWKACQSIIRDNKTKESYLRLSVSPANSISAYGIQSKIEEWHRKNWYPDIVVVDYADILSPLEGSFRESRDQINATWMALRAMALRYGILVVTATQTDADSYDKEIIGKKNFSGDKRKNAHVAGMIGLNANEGERDNGVMRLNWVVRREAKFSEKKCCHVAGCLALANPCLLSTF